MSDNARAAILMTLSGASFAAMGAFVKAAAELPTMEKVLVRNLLTLLAAGALALAAGRPLLGRWRHQPLLTARSVLGLGGVTCYFYAVDHLLLADATMLTKLSPVFVAIFALVFLREQLRPGVVLALLISLIGGALIIKPRFDVQVLPALVGLGSAVFAGAAYTVVRSLRSREHPETIIFHFSLVTVVGVLPVAWPVLRMPNLAEAGFLVGIGVFAAIGQLAMTFAYRDAPAAQISIFSYTMILFSALLGFIFWHELPDSWSLLGGLLIIFGGLLSFLSERKSAPQANGVTMGS